MKLIETELPGLFLIELEPVRDDRGFFARTFCRHRFAEHDLVTDFPQCNIAFNKRKATLRGMHFRRAPHAEARLVRCTRGAIYDVALDLRPDSSTFCRWFAAELTPENDRMMFIPQGFAHGYQTLQGDTEVSYWMSEFYAPDCEAGVRWDDPAFAISWPIADPIVSKRDAEFPDFKP